MRPFGQGFVVVDLRVAVVVVVDVRRAVLEHRHLRDLADLANLVVMVMNARAARPAAGLSRVRTTRTNSGSPLSVKPSARPRREPLELREHLGRRRAGRGTARSACLDSRRVLAASLPVDEGDAVLDAVPLNTAASSGASSAGLTLRVGERAGRERSATSAAGGLRATRRQTASRTTADEMTADTFTGSLRVGLSASRITSSVRPSSPTRGRWPAGG